MTEDRLILYVLFVMCAFMAPVMLPFIADDGDRLIAYAALFVAFLNGVLSAYLVNTRANR
jgi:hypothetical protein